MKYVIVILSFLTHCLFAQSTLNLYSNYETIGLNIILSQDDIEFDAFASIQYKKATETTWENGFPLSRIENNNNMLAGTIFWCDPNKSYDIKVTIVDSTTSALNGQILNGVISTRDNITFPETNQILYVSPNGFGTAFSISSPGNIQDALNIATAGTKVILGSGDYYIGDLTIPNNGTASKPIQIIGSSEGKVILNGSHPNNLTWAPYGNNGVYVTTTDNVNPNLVIADGIRLFPHQTFPDLKINKATLTRDIFTNPDIQEDINFAGYYRNPTLQPAFGNYGDPIGITTNKLYIKFLDNSDPNSKNIIVTKQPLAIDLTDNQFIYFQNISFKYFGLGHIASAVVLDDSQYILFDNCLFEDNNTSIKYTGNSQYITIQNTTFKDHHNDWRAWKMKATQDAGVFNSRFPFGSRNLEKGAIICGDAFIGKNIVIRDNLFENYHQTGQLTPTPTTDLSIDTLKRTLEIDFYNNTINDVTGDGFELEGIVRNVRVFKNTFNNVHAPFSMAAAKEGPSYILRNTFSNLAIDTTFFDDSLLQSLGHPIKFQFSDTTSAGNGSIFFFHNTIDAKNSSYGFNIYQVSIKYAWKELVSKNNIFNTTNGISLNVRTLTVPKLDSDYNGYYSQNSDIAKVNTNNSTAINYTTIDQVYTDHNWDEHSVQSNPMFDASLSTPYELMSASPMIDAGVLIEGINDMHIMGSDPDIGAHEYGLPLGIIETKQSESNFLVYPNPSNSRININQLTKQSDYTITLIDLHGRVIYRGDSDTNSFTTILDVTNYLSGVYFLVLKSEESVELVKIVKSN